MNDDTRKSHALAELLKCQTEFVTSDEWGIYSESDQTAILADLATASINIDSKNFPSAEHALMSACLKMNKAQNTWEPWHIGIWYRLNARFGLIAFLWSCAFSATFYYIAFYIIRPLEFDKSIEQPAFWGLLGAFTKSLYWLQTQIGSGTLRPRFHSYFLVAPSVGLCLGGALWLVTTVAFKIFIKDPSNVNPDWTVAALIAFFGGFKWEWALETIEAMSNKLKSGWASK